jgi:hypothetical protein
MARFFKRLAWSVLFACVITLGILLTGNRTTSGAFYLGIALAVGGQYAHDWVEVKLAERRIRRFAKSARA